MAADITSIAGIGSNTAAVLVQHKYSTIASIANTTVEKLSTVPGFSIARADKVINSAKQVLNLAGREPANDVDTKIDASENESSSEAVSDGQPVKNATKVVSTMPKGKKKEKNKAKNSKDKKAKKNKKKDNKKKGKKGKKGKK